MIKPVCVDACAVLTSAVVCGTEEAEEDDRDASSGFREGWLSGCCAGKQDHEPIVFVGFPRNFRSCADRNLCDAVDADSVDVRYEEPSGESVPYEEMGLSRFL